MTTLTECVGIFLTGTALKYFVFQLYVQTDMQLLEHAYLCQQPSLLPHSSDFCL